MKPSETTDDMPFHYDDVKWRKIRESLKVVGVDADTATVLQGKAQGSLREELERLAQDYRTPLPGPPTARQFTEEISNNATKIAAVRDLFAPQLWPVAYLLGEKRTAEIHALLTSVETELQAELKSVKRGGYIGTLRYEGRGHNASKPALRGYLLRLARVWHELAGESAASRQRNRFILECAAPVADISIKNVRDFLSSGKTKTTI